jgi:hypothetical protein
MSSFWQILLVACTFSATGFSAIDAQVYDYSHSEPMFFDNEAVATGSESPGYGRGAAMVDLDNDGRLDLIVTTAGMEDQFYRQLPTQRFSLMNGMWAMPGNRDETWGVLAADFDNDGDKDIYFVNGGFSGAEVNVLIRNDLNTLGKFTDVSATSGACNLMVANFGGTTFDYDNDGDLDIFLSSSLSTGSVRPPCELYRNDGNLRFTNVSAISGIIQQGDFKHCSAGDYNNDGFVDVMVGNFDQANILYHNNGDGTFTDKALAAGVQDPYRSFGASFEDFNNDGFLDLFIPKYEFTGARTSSLFINNKDGTFREDTAFGNMTSQGDMGHSTADINADGFPDIFIGTGHPYFERKDLVKAMFPTRYNDSMASREVASYLGLDAVGLSRSHGYAFGDIDRDGDIDLYNNNGGPSQIQNTWGLNALYLAQGNNANWMMMNLEGIKSNREAIGARIKVETNGDREVWRYPTIGKGFCNTDSPTQHFGLGFDTATELTEIYWPSGITQSYVALETQTTHDIVESGLMFTGTPTVGGFVTLSLTGPRNGSITLEYSTTLDYKPDPYAHVIDRLGGIPDTYGQTGLGSDGKTSFQFWVPATAVSGSSLFLQATVTGPANSSYSVVKTNAIELQIL